MHNKYKKAMKNSAIFLMHDLHENEKVLSFLMGYEKFTVSELLDLKQDRYFDSAGLKNPELLA
jgi:hypothetical protein